MDKDMSIGFPTSTTQPKLLPCPFCGGELRLIESWARSFHPPRLYREVHHDNEHCPISKRIVCTAPNTDSLEDFVKVWNTRAALSSPAEVEGDGTTPGTESSAVPTGDRKVEFAYTEYDKKLTAALPKFAVYLEPRPDGGLRISSDDLPGLILSASNPHKCVHVLWHSVLALAEHGESPIEPFVKPDPHNDAVREALERAAKICDQVKVGYVEAEKKYSYDMRLISQGGIYGAEKCAEEIRESVRALQPKGVS